MKVILAIILFFATAASGQRVKDMSANNFSYLDTIFNNKRIVMLGESSHGTEEYSQVKKQLIQYLHEKHGFNVVLFESPMTNCSYLNAFADSNATELVRNSIQSVWHTETVRELFRYIKSSGIQFNGFDPQYISSPYPALVYTSAFKDWPAILADVLELDKRISNTINNPSKYLSLKDSFSTAYGQLAQKLEKQNLSPFQQWMRHTLAANVPYYARIREGNQRDSGMAKNIIWLAENLYKNEKVIVWAHNMHIDRNATSPKRLMGKLLSDHFKDQLYGIGLYMLNGTTALNSRKIVQVEVAPKGSMEEMVNRSGFKISFVETNDPVFDKRLPTLHWGRDIQKMNLAKSYNAIILVNGVSAPVYLK